MQLLSEEGKLKTFERRRSGLKRGLESDEMFEWKSFVRKSKYHKEKLTILEPDIVKTLNERERQKKELERQKEEKRKRGEWDYCGESGEWFWTGETEPENLDQFCFQGMTEEEKIAFRKAEDKLMEDMEKQRKVEREERRKQMQEKQK